MKKVLFFSLLLVFMMVLAACGNETKTASSAGPARESIKIITTAGGYPFAAKNKETGEVEGFMTDIMNELASRLQLNTTLTTGEWNSLIPSVQSGKADVIVDGMYITEERKEVINFTDPVFAYGEGLIVKEGDTTTKSLEDLRGKTVGVQLGTSFKDMLEEKNKDLGLKIKTYQTLADMLKDIQNGRVDAVLGDSPSFSYLLSTNPKMNFRIVEEYEPTLVGQIGIGIAKGNTELVEKLNGEIEKMKEDGTLKEIYKKWAVDWDFK